MNEYELMNVKQEYPYWMALAHTERMRTARKNELIIRCCHERQLNLSDFFLYDSNQWRDEFDLSDEEIGWLQNAKAELPNYSFLAEDLLEQGYDMIPILSPDYPKTLKANLKKSYAPPLIYTKGNKKLLQETSIAIVGSRSAGNISLDFTDAVAKQAVANGKLVVSGYAKGVDKQALDSALKHGGKSIVILPQGITTFASGFKALYREIIQGKVLVLSAFPPKAPWSAGLAMARNPIIYGMAHEIYVAESDSKGGTWAGVIDGLRKMRTIYVRQPLPEEKNANEALIKKGAIPVSLQGEILYQHQEEQTLCVSEPAAEYEGLQERIRKALRNRTLSSKELVERLSLNWSTRKMTDYLRTMEEIETLDQKPKKFALKGANTEPTLF